MAQPKRGFVPDEVWERKLLDAGVPAEAIPKLMAFVDQEAQRLRGQNEARGSTSTQEIRALICPWNHVLFWPEDLQPYPDTCVAKIASVPDGEMPCNKALTPGALFERIDEEICYPCRLEVHTDCRRHDAEPCACDETTFCGVRLRVFVGDAPTVEVEGS